MVGVVKNTTESVVEGLSAGTRTGAKMDCRGLLVGLSWLLLVVCVLRSRRCTGGSSRSRKKTTLNVLVKMSQVRKVLY